MNNYNKIVGIRRSLSPVALRSASHARPLLCALVRRQSTMPEHSILPPPGYGLPPGDYKKGYFHPMPTQHSSMWEKPELAVSTTTAVKDATKALEMPQLLKQCWSRGAVIARIEDLYYEGYPETPPAYPLAPVDLGPTPHGSNKMLGLSVVMLPPYNVDYFAVGRSGRRDRLGGGSHPLYSTNVALEVPRKDKPAQTYSSAGITSSSTSCLTQGANPSDVYTRQTSQARGIHTTATATANPHLAEGSPGAAYLGCDPKDKLHGPVSLSGFRTPFVSIGRINSIDPDADDPDPDYYDSWTTYALVGKLNSDWYVEGLFAIPVNTIEDDGDYVEPYQKGIYYLGKDMEEAAQRKEWELIQPLGPNEEVLVTNNMPWESIHGKDNCDWSWSK